MSVVALVQQLMNLQHQLKINGDNNHPANFGRLCSKGSALGDTIELKTRLLQPRVYGHETSWMEALDVVADTFSKMIAKYGRMRWRFMVQDSY